MKPLPCAYCNTIPNVRAYDDFWEQPVVERWLASGCFVCHQFTGYPIAAWNEDMTKLLELRRQDYLAGFYNGALKSFDDYIAEGKGDES